MASRKAKEGADVAVALPANAPKGTDLMAQADATLAGMFVTVIDSPLMYELASAELIELQAAHDELEEKRFSITRPMDAAKAAVMALFKTPQERLKAKITALKQAMLEYKKEQDRLAAIKQERLDKIAAASRAQLAAEQAAKAAEAEEAQRQAEALLASGDTAAASELLDRAEEAQAMSVALGETVQVVSAATAANDVPTIAGINTADVWQARVTDLPALLRFIADHPEYHEWVELKMTGLHDMAKAQRTELRVPGVEAFEEARIAASRGRKAA